MQYKKTPIAELEKCYALSPLTVEGVPHLLVAAEKHAPCYLFTLDGKKVDTIWEEPGGIMTMVPVPGLDATFLATHQFYSPNDSAQAKLVCAQRKGPGNWTISTIAELPFVHRFDLFVSGGKTHLIACTLKSDHEYKNDWRFPGKLWTAVLSDDPAAPLELQLLRDGLGHNHGYTRTTIDGVDVGVVSCDQGVFLVTPPQRADDTWQVEQILDQPTSDAVLIDLDKDGEQELLTLSPFHGDQIAIWHKNSVEQFEMVYKHPKKTPFLHAIYAGDVYGQPAVFAGNREGERDLFYFRFDEEQGYHYDVIDQGAGPANCLLFQREGRPVLLASNREINEVALYDIYPD